MNIIRVILLLSATTFILTLTVSTIIELIKKRKEINRKKAEEIKKEE